MFLSHEFPPFMINDDWPNIEMLNGLIKGTLKLGQSIRSFYKGVCKRMLDLLKSVLGTVAR
jgi:hypothetical protein